MASSPSLPAAGPKPVSIRPLWSHHLPAHPRGVSLVRERGGVLAWDTHDWICLLNRNGERQAQWHAPDRLVMACCADDGSAYAAVGARGEVWWLAPDLMPRWTRAMPHAATAAAMEPLGEYLAVADGRGNLHLYDRAGRAVYRIQAPRPLHFLAFVPAAPWLIGSADYGLVACFDAAGRLAWRDGLVAHVGSLAVSGDGGLIVLACFSEGLQRYTSAGRNLGRLAAAEPCRLASMAFDGSALLVAGLGNQIRLLDREGRARAMHPFDRPAAALALGPLGDKAVVALIEGAVIGLDLREGD
jgi:hypothetical protein